MATIDLGVPAVRPRPAPEVDAAGLAAALGDAVEGEVRFDQGSRGAYSTDASNYRQVPIGVVVPRTVEDVVATVATCRAFGAPVLSRGGGTSLAGQCCNVAVVMDFSKYLHQVLEMDPDRRLARVRPGIVLDDLRRAAAPHRLTFGPDPATHDHCTLGGMLGNNSCGMHAQMAGRTSDNTRELEVLTYDGLRLRVGETGDAERAEIIASGGRRGELYRRLERLVDRKQAVRLGRAFADEGVTWFEEPVSSDDLDGLREVRDQCPADVDAGEYGYDLAYFRRMAQAGAVDCLQADVSRCAGVTEWLWVAALAAAHNLELSGHCAQSLSVHAAAAVPNLRHLEYFADHARVDRLLFDGVLEPAGGVLRPDLSRPGMGLELKRADVQRYREET